MNRAIKFRAWHKRLKRMYPVRAIDFAASPMEVHLQSDAIALDTFLDKRDVELMQFTGMTDKNGREVYEGDILKSEQGWMVAVEAGFSTPAVSLVLAKEEGSESPALFSKTDHLEIIGNIYENPELMKASNQ